MSDEGRYLAICAPEGDAFVDSAGKVCDAVLKVVVRDLHHVFIIFSECGIAK